MPKLLRIEGAKVAPPVLVTQTEPTKYAPAGTNRLGTDVVLGIPRPLAAPWRRKGPPILARQQAQTNFATEWVDRPGGVVPPSPLLMNLCSLTNLGPPIIVRTQTRQTGFPTEGNNRFVAPIRNQPLLKFRIGKKGPLLLNRQQQFFPSGGAVFPTQYGFLSVRKTGSSIFLCAVATADAPAGMGGQLRVYKGGATYSLYLVETTDPNEGLYAKFQA